MFKNGEFAFELIHHKKLDAFQEELKKKSMQATFKNDNHHLALLKTELSQLTREKIISKDFEEILQERLETMTDID